MLLEDFLQDTHYAFRIVWQKKTFSTIVVLVLALGIGVNTAVFSIVHALILKPLPFRDAARLVAVWDTYLPQFSTVGISPPELETWQSQKGLFEETTWYRHVPLEGNLSVSGTEPVVVHAAFVAANFFPMLGLSPRLGRRFTANEDPQSALISERVWHSRFQSDPTAVGKTVRFNDGQLTVVGIMPEAAQFPDWTDLWLPKGPLLADQLTNPVRHALGFIGRLKRGISKEQATARLKTLSAQLAREHPQTSTGWGMRVNGLQDDLTQNVRPALLLLFGAASFLLFVACINISSLLLSRASARATEMAVRAAVGAGMGRIVRQLVTESLLFGLAGGTLGLAAAKIALTVVVPSHSQIGPAIVLFLFGLSIVTGTLFGLAPALQAARTDPQSIIRSGTATGGGSTLRSVLVVSELALTMVLVIGAGILAKSFVRLMHVNPGFNPEGVLTMRILAPRAQQPDVLFHRLQANLLPLPGVRKIAFTNALPLIADRANTSRFNVPGSPLINPEALPAAQIRTASPGYFSAMQIAVRAGRTFTENDLNQPVVIVNETMAKRFWPNKNPVGLKFINGPWGPNPSWATIIGVVADVKQFGLDSEPSFDIYYPSLQGQYLILKTDGTDLDALAQSVQRVIRTTEPELAFSDVRSFAEIASQSALTRHWTMGLLTFFACMALLLALVGVFGVVSWSVAQRTREIGIRMTLGARREQILLLVLRYGLKLALAGLLCGIVASFGLRQVLANMVFGVSTGDPVIYGSVATLMLIVTLLACYLPARKGATVDPLTSLRES